MNTFRRVINRWALWLVFAGALWFANERTGGDLFNLLGRVTGDIPPSEDDTDRIIAAFAQQRSNEWVEASGTVTRLLPDDNEGSRHQRFIVELPPGHTLLIAHNIDLAPRIDALEVGDAVTFRGEYEWNRQGGVVHWTHADPGGRRGGWIRHEGQKYR